MSQNKQTDALRKTIDGLHACHAAFDHDEELASYNGAELAWSGAVSVFNIEGNPKASICYAWSESIKNSNKRRFFAVLKVPPVDSAEAAVRASIVADYKESRNGKQY